MKKYTSWPIPSYKHNRTIPPIPKSFTIFHKNYKVINNKPHLNINIEPKNFDKLQIKNLLSKSYNLYKNIIKNIITNNGNEIANNATSLRNLHDMINNYLNACRDDEIVFIKMEERNKFLKRRHEIVEELDNIINNVG